MATAIYNPNTNAVKTFIRDDYGDYTPPAPYTLVPSDQLPPGWQLEPAPPDTFLQDLRNQVLERLDESQQQERMIDRALALTLLDMYLEIRVQHNALLTYLGNQTGLTQRNQIPGFALPEITTAQLRTRIRNKITAGNADNAIG